MSKIAILDDYQNVALTMADWSVVPDEHEIVVFDDHLADIEQVADRLKDFDIICIMRERTPLPRQLIEMLPNLKLLITSGMRNASIDLAAAADAGVTVCGTGASGYATAELAWSLILALVRNIGIEDRSMRERGWQNTIGNELRGKTIGILGLGRLGGRVASYARAFEMNVLAWSQNLTAERAAECGAELVPLDDLLARSDVVTVHLVLSDRTRNLLGAAELAKLKPTAYLVNTSRGPIVNEVALMDVLEHGRIRGAGLDVFDVEPLPFDHPMRNLSNAILTPHVGYVTEETYRIFFTEMVENIVAYMDGAPIRVLQAPPTS